MLKTMVEEHPNQWDQLLPKALMHYRSAVNASTGFTPYRLMFGREMRLPIDAMMGDPPGMTPKLLPQYVADQRDQILTTEQMARDNLQMAQRHQKDHYDIRSKVQHFKVNDLVLLYSSAVPQGVHKKFFKRWTGPWKVVNVLSDVDYRIHFVGSDRGRLRRVRKVVHTNHLKMYHIHPILTDNAERAHRPPEVDETGCAQKPPGEDGTGRAQRPPGEDGTGRAQRPPGEDGTGRAQRPPGEIENWRAQRPPGVNDAGRAQSPPTDDVVPVKHTRHGPRPPEVDTGRAQRPPEVDDTRRAQRPPDDDTVIAQRSIEENTGRAQRPPEVDETGRAHRPPEVDDAGQVQKPPEAEDTGSAQMSPGVNDTGHAQMPPDDEVGRARMTDRRTENDSDETVENTEPFVGRPTRARRIPRKFDEFDMNWGD
ncbi:MAG: hypothetical protein ABW185_28855 [Sedimenticola sp.]